VILSEQELSIEIADFNVVIISAVNSSFGATADTHQSEGLDILTSESTSANHESLDLS
jgi:hypothetical protein